MVWQSSVLGLDIVLSELLLRVATFLGAFSGFYFTVYISPTAPTASRSSTGCRDIRQAFAVRTAYLSGRR